MPFTSRLLSTFMVEYQTQFYWNFAWIIFFSVVVVVVVVFVFSFFFSVLCFSSQFLLERIQMLCDVLGGFTYIGFRSNTIDDILQPDAARVHLLILLSYSHIYNKSTHKHNDNESSVDILTLLYNWRGLCVCVDFIFRAWLLQMTLCRRIAKSLILDWESAQKTIQINYHYSVN